MSSHKEKSRNMLFWGWLGLIIGLYVLVMLLGLSIGWFVAKL